MQKPKNKIRTLFLTTGALGACLSSSNARAAELLMPQNRTSFYSNENIELAVAGLNKGDKANVEITPKTGGANAVSFSLTGDGGALNAILPPRALAPGEYSVRLDGKDAGKLQVMGGVLSSTMLTSQTDSWDKLKAGGGNFVVGNAFSFGLLDSNGAPLKTDLRGKHSSGMQVFDRAIDLDLPSLVYMYWTGYVTHKPFGSEKSWANADMTRLMRLMSFHTAQRIRHYNQNIISVGTLDEPGLSWGKTPAGGSASGFPNVDEKDWYQARGWKYTDDPASRPDADWMKYVSIRNAIMKEQNAQAKKDLQAVWPGLVFSTDLYAPQAMMDGTDPMNQEVNDIPSSHVFVDWGYGKAGLTGGAYIEKAFNPTAKLAHAMNGRLFGEAVPQPQHRYAYHAMQNALLMAGIHSNWWLNFGEMNTENLNAVNEPAKRIGPVFQNMTPVSDTAILWSFTELAMRLKDVTAREAKKKSGEQIKLMIASWPELNEITGGGERAINAYDVGGNYKEQIVATHQALGRAGFPSHVVDERIVARGVLSNYKTLIITGQTFALPQNVKTAIAEFQKRGGKIIVDNTTTQTFAGATKTTANFKDPYFRWANVFSLDPKTNSKVTVKQASFYQTNSYMDEQAKAAANPMKAAMKTTLSQPVFESASTDFTGERHAAGEGQLAMILNAREELPQIKDDEKYLIWNYASQTASVTLKGVPTNSVVYCIEGLDWKKSSLLKNPVAAQNMSFAPGEMKLFLIAPRAPRGLKLQSKIESGALRVAATLQNLKMPWPLLVTIKNSAGQTLYQVFRATDAKGEFNEAFPIGSNSAAGEYSVSVEGLAASENVRAQEKIRVAQSVVSPQTVAGNARVFDEGAIKKFLANKPAITIALGDAKYAASAQKLAAALNANGVKARVLPEAQALRKAKYPRVWNPFAKMVEAKGDVKMPEGAEVKLRISLDAKNDGSFTARDETGKDWTDDWKQPNSLVTVSGDGYVDFLNVDQEHVYQPGVQLYFNKDRQMQIVKGEMSEAETTEEFKAKWSRPWPRLSSYVGGYQVPAQLPEAWETEDHLILLGDSTSSEAVAALQASELLPQVVDEKYPGAGKALIQFAWSPFAVEKNVVFIGASDAAGIDAGIARLSTLF